MPTSIGYRDAAAFFAPQPGVSERSREHLIASPFGTIHAATFSFSRPIGTAMPEPLGVQPINFDPQSRDAKAGLADQPPTARRALQVEYPTVNRRLKGDRMPSPQGARDSSQPASLPPLQPIDAPASQPASPPAPVPGARPKSADRVDGTPSDIQTIAVTQDQYDDAGEADPEGDDRMADRPPEIPAAGETDALDVARSPFASLSFLDEDVAERNAQLYFGVAAIGARGGLERWEPGAAPVPATADPDIKLSALEGRADAGAGETVAGKGEATRFKSPADRLGLSGKSRAKAEKCIADAVYFEARGEPLRGQMAVAQVVMNRVFSGRYPNNVCGVVYQNAERHLACQFTFACEGKDLSRIDEPDMWEQAKRIATDTLDGKIWLTEVGHATHYHAYWVHPSWVNEMAKLYKLGVHTFYRPRAWGDGSDAPIWGNVPVKPETAKGPAGASKGPEAAVKVPPAAAAPEAAAIKKTHTARL